MMWQIVAAIVGAWCVAIGAAAQERPACEATGHSVGKLSLVTQLLTSRRWLTGAGITGCGMALHLAAIVSAPLSIVQPLGISGLLVGVWIAARWRGRSLHKREVLGAIAVTAGLTGLIASLPQQHSSRAADDNALALVALVVLTVAVIASVSGSALSERVRAWLFAGVAGACFGVTAAFVRLMAREALTDISALLHWHSLVIAVSVLLGSWLLQNAYRANHFGMSYATLLVCDPVMAAGIGFVVLHEPLPSSVATSVAAVVSSLITVLGVIALSSSQHTRTIPAPHGDAGVDNEKIEEPESVECNPDLRRYADANAVA